MKKIAIFFIKFYQKLISPSLGSTCRFYPSCSQYMIDSINKFGIIKGIWNGYKRIHRCSPENPNVGFDPVPDTFSWNWNGYINKKDITEL